MKGRIIALLIALGVGTAAAQTPATGVSRLAWDQANADAATANSYTYKYYADGSTTGVTLTGVVCTDGSPVVCRAPFPAFAPGQHTITLTASNAAGESAKSVPLSFTFVVVPSAPGNPRIEQVQ